MTDIPVIHVPVMPAEVLEWLAPAAGQTLVDCTLGGGGHTRMLAEAIGSQGLVISLDRDPSAIAAAERNLQKMPIKLVHSDYSDLTEVLKQLEVPGVDGVLLDLGLSSDQLADASRGFSFDADGPLDLRFNADEGEPAWRLLERLPEDQIADLIYKFGEERYSRRIARRIVERRDDAPVRTARDMAELVRRAVPKSPRAQQAIDPATRTFQALRIAVNHELRSLERLLGQVSDCLLPGGKVAAISFHSLEDRLVKNAFRDDPRLEVLTRKPLRAAENEVLRNPRARSAKLRVARKIG